ncbi:glycosyltransferase [Flavobacterium granuli]|uniref:GT2 family glycosyltransferase n=1 Tax=Flavobacterium granuli TaxID=280093 RepID=A0A1M5QJT4_9FLAO|nr:glycosyltransferase [Flavobacterium granuli]PRZ20084.1 GT2 family glycosyltransferase [Flavobacterium granuli]SHH14394.1 Glycosyltransferase, GT2 family [Flavobacterium granuli]
MLAIIIPYYKFTFFEVTLESLASQINQRFKVYIGDDASPENPSDLLEHYKGKFDFEYHRFEENLGGISLTKQWERCIALSGNEEWIMILGDDDVLGENVVEGFYGNLPEIEQDGINVVRFATRLIDEKGDCISRIYQHPKLEKGLDFFIRKLKWETRSSLSEYIFKRKSFLEKKIQYYPFGFYSDDRAWVDFAADKPIFSINNILIFIRISSQSLSGSTDKNIVKKSEYLYVKHFYDNELERLSKKNRLFILKKVEFFFYLNKKINLIDWILLYIRYFKCLDIKELYRFHKRLFKFFLNEKSSIYNT